eukprot:scaffold1780_cov215-Prasinococcus_capsulatus_cf.AAC.2
MPPPRAIARVSSLPLPPTAADRAACAHATPRRAARGVAVRCQLATPPYPRHSPFGGGRGREVIFLNIFKADSS